MQMISQQTGISFEIVQCETWQEVLTKAKNREVDMLPAAAQTPERAKYMLFSKPYLIFPGVIITTKRNEKLNSTRELHQKKVGMVSGYVWHEYISKDHPEIQIVEVDNITTALRNVSIGEIDAVIVTLPIALYYIEQEGIHNLIVAGETEYSTNFLSLSAMIGPFSIQL